MDLNWFLLEDLAKHPLSMRSWIVLRQLELIETASHYAQLGWLQEFQGVASAIYPTSEKQLALELDYTYLNHTWPHRPFIQDGEYQPAGTILPDRGLPVGRYLVLEQRFDGRPVPEDWHLDQDLVLGLGLVRQGDKWIAASEDKMLVGRLHRDEDGSPKRVEILAEHLRDYLAARNCGLVIASYMSREAVVKDTNGITWKSDETRPVPHGEWKGFIRAVHPSGLPYGEQIGVLRVFRTDTENAGEAPVFDMFDENLEAERYVRGDSGGPLYYVEGALNRTEWFGPGPLSVRVRGDEEPRSGIVYKIGTDGSTATADELLNPPVRYLYFRPEIVRVIVERPSGSLTWYTGETGGLSYRAYQVHFGVATTGLITVRAKEIAQLPAEIQKSWVAQNVTPQGPVSVELLAAQMRAEPAATIAPEVALHEALSRLESSWAHAFGEPLLYPRVEAESEMTRLCHRFRALNDEELRRLAKDLYRFTVERLDEKLLRKLAPPAPGEDGRRSLGLLADLLKDRGQTASGIAPLQALNQLRQDDSHLAASDRSKALGDLGLGTDMPYPHKGAALIAAVVRALTGLADEIDQLRP